MQRHWGDQRVDIFGLSSAGDVWHKAYDHGWGAWEKAWAQPAGPATHGPGAVGLGEGRMSVVVGKSAQLIGKSYNWGALSAWGNDAQSENPATRADMTSW